jgi:hypothetical protein
MEKFCPIRKHNSGRPARNLVTLLTMQMEAAVAHPRRLQPELSFHLRENLSFHVIQLFVYELGCWLTGWLIT